MADPQAIKEAFERNKKAIKLRPSAVSIESLASEEKVQEVIEKADAHSPVLDDFKRPIPVKREVKIKSKEIAS